MEQVSENVIVITSGEEFPENFNQEAIKIYLAGSMSSNDTSNTYDWQSVFINKLVDLTNSKDGLIMMKNQEFIIINPRYAATDPTPSLQNQEFVFKMDWMHRMKEAADVVICNFLKKSESPVPFLELGTLLASEKLVVRCPEEYPGYPFVKIMCEKYNVPLYPAKSSVKDLVHGMYAFIPKLQEINKYKLPE